MVRITYSEISSLDNLKLIFSDLNVNKIVIKNLSPNDNSKNQLYLGMGFDAAQVFPHTTIIADKTQSSRAEPKFKAKLNFSWFDATGRISNAPDAQLILYPKYPEVRFSGFLNGCGFNLTSLMGTEARIQNRIMIWGISGENLYGHVISPENPLSDYLRDTYIDEGITLTVLNSFEKRESSLDLLIEKLCYIHKKGWIDSNRLESAGNSIEYSSQNAGGYTLEAEFGITPNGYSEPDFLDWELKQYSVPSFNRLYSKPITLMTPEPTGGIYKKEGVKRFLTLYGYPDTSGKENRINFGGVHQYGCKQSKTSLTLFINGYNNETCKITDSTGAIVLIDEKDNITAEWSFVSIIEHWNRKHRHAAYIPSQKRKVDRGLQYYFGNIISLGEYTDSLKLLEAISKGDIYYDPGIKWENSNLPDSPVKRRSQFRIKTVNLESLYKSFRVVNVLPPASDI